MCWQLAFPAIEHSFNSAGRFSGFKLDWQSSREKCSLHGLIWALRLSTSMRGKRASSVATDKEAAYTHVLAANTCGSACCLACMHTSRGQLQASVSLLPLTYVPLLLTAAPLQCEFLTSCI